tara:strand:- start:6124 stop:6624 length:501 start_codon:yes stop_codon:yes gene_type:complete
MRIKLISIFFISFLFYSCETDDSVPVDEYGAALLGSWSRTDVIPSGGSEADYRYFDMVATYRFLSDYSYSYTIDFYGFEDDDPEEIIGSSENTGTYRVEGDSVFIKAMVNTSWDKVFQPNPETIDLNVEAYASRFKIVDDKLTLYYISYPADAPIAAEISYIRQNP